jgi:hypothetical protein
MIWVGEAAGGIDKNQYLWVARAKPEGLARGT